MKLLLISNSTNAGEPYLKYPIAQIGKHLEGVSVGISIYIILECNVFPPFYRVPVAIQNRDCACVIGYIGTTVKCNYCDNT